MNHVRSSVAEASRRFADCVNRVHYQQQTFVLLKNGIPFARLVPAGEPVFPGSDLAEALAAVTLSDAHARALQRGLKNARQKLKTPDARWALVSMPTCIFAAQRAPLVL